MKSAKKSDENAKKQHALQRAKERFLTRLSSSELTSSSSPSASTSSTYPSPPSSTNSSPPSSPVPSILADHPQPSVNPPFPAPNPIPSTTNHYQPYPNTYPYPPFPVHANCPPYPLPYHQPAPTDPTTTPLYLSLLTGCSDSSSKSARILELEEQLDREREGADIAESKLWDVMAEQTASQATHLDSTVKYVIIRSEPVTEGYSLLHSMHPVAVPKQWLETTLCRSERKGAAFTVKIIDGLVEEDHTMTTSFFRKKHSALLLALEAFAREKNINHSEWCRIISDKIALLQRSANAKGEGPFHTLASYDPILWVPQA